MTSQPGDTLDDEELGRLLAALREDTLTIEDGHRLEQLMRESDEALRIYIRMLALQADLCGALVGWSMVEPATTAGAEVDTDGPTPAAVLTPTVSPQATAGFQETLIGQAVFEAALQPHEDDEEEPLTLPPWSPSAPPVTRGAFAAGGRGWRVVGVVAGIMTSVAAVVMLAIFLWPHGRAKSPRPGPVAAVIRSAPQAPTSVQATQPTVLITPPPPVVASVSASLDATWRGQDAPRGTGARLRAGTHVELVRGYARLTFVNGVEVVVEAPASLTLDAVDRVLLDVGRLTAKVPEPARGFAVRTKLANVVDLGTEFGLNAAADGTVDVPVFKGRVEARPASGLDAAPVEVSAGSAGRVDHAGVDIHPIGPDAASFVRDIRQIRGVVPTRSTGQGLTDGDPDPNWLITSASYDRNWTPRPALVCGPGPRGLANDPRSAWISSSGTRAAVPGGKYVFETTFDLSRFDPTTAQLHLRLGVDDRIREVHLNGRPTDVRLFLPGSTAKSQLHDFDLHEGFVPGVNRLDVFLENASGPGAKKAPTAMALRVELSGTAVRKLDGQ